MKSLKAGINKVICAVVEDNTSPAILVPNKNIKYIIMTCDPALKFKHGEEAIIYQNRGIPYKIDDEDFLILDSGDILATLKEE